jgi:hypothetical protein
MSAFIGLSNNKIGESTGEMICFWFFFGHLILAYPFSLYFSL